MTLQFRYQFIVAISGHQIADTQQLNNIRKSSQSTPIIIGGHTLHLPKTMAFKYWRCGAIP